jgi:arylsulfatase A-like enzyme/thioredoxin-like negative regulator of GroEL
MASTRASRSAGRNGKPTPLRQPHRHGRNGAVTGVLGVLLILGLAAWGWWYAGGGAGSAGPVILVVVDTLRADRLPVYGYSSGRAPVLSAFAQEAVVFDRAYAHAPQTLPSHASMFTGRLPFEHQVRDNLGFTLSAGSPTLAAMFQASGYRTGGFVSAFVLRPDTGVAQGFDVYDATFPAMAADRSAAQVQRAGTETLAAAEKWLASLSSDRFFLFLHLYEPHTPYRAPDRYADLAPYDGEVAFADEIVGRLFASLRARGWYDNATIMVLSDHGEGLGDHIEEEHGLFLYDEVVRVPWIMRLPRGQSAGRRVKDPVQHIDLLPTLAALAALTAPTGLRGRDLSAALFDRGPLPPQGIYAEALYPRYHFGWSELLSLTDDRYRYIKAPREELYDLERDPDEQTNIAAERGQAATALRSALDALVAGRGIDVPSAVSDDDRQRLAALGYVGTQSASALALGGTRPDPKDKAPLLRAYRRAVEAIGAGQLDEGTRMLRAILDDDPAMTDVWSQYAAALGRLGRYQDAFEAYARVIALQPEEPNGPLGAASMLLSLNRTDDARAHAELALRSAPSQAHQALALIEVSRKRDAEALRQADLAAAADPGLPMPAFIRGTLAYNNGQYDQALRFLLDARKGFAQRSAQARDLYFMIGDSLARLERYEEARPYLEEEVRLYPQHVRARAGLAMLFQSMGRGEEAERTLAALVRDVPSREAADTAASVWRMFDLPDRAASAEAEARRRSR